MNKSKKHGYMRIIAALLSVIMLFGVMPLNAFAAETAGDWVIDGEKVLEIDILNFICFVNGVDYLEPVRKALGK